MNTLVAFWSTLYKNTREIRTTTSPLAVTDYPERSLITVSLARRHNRAQLLQVIRVIKICRRFQLGYFLRSQLLYAEIEIKTLICFHSP
jgi:hypothetical protein